MIDCSEPSVSWLHVNPAILLRSSKICQYSYHSNNKSYYTSATFTIFVVYKISQEWKKYFRQVVNSCNIHDLCRAFTTKIKLARLAHSKKMCLVMISTIIILSRYSNISLNCTNPGYPLKLPSFMALHHAAFIFLKGVNFAGHLGYSVFFWEFTDLQVTI